ncbi:hypothetical protein [Dialister micraerophilus]|uniref:hypothetical protein n=1 Tax=Dialister micraerophilus TaxID=309120 RepID=UPI0023F34289|nr:hypothetical protein [Dialister micraerophilus]
MKDLTGKQFGRLKVIYPLKKRSKERGIIWHCKCACGKETNVKAGSLISKRTKSCGCLRHKPPEKHKDGVLLSRLFSLKPKKNNQSGYRGVTLFRNKYQSRIYLKGKRYFLGTFDTAIEAYEAYLKVKKELHFTLLKKYNYKPKKLELFKNNSRILHGCMD